jgi:hypothetical protein
MVVADTVTVVELEYQRPPAPVSDAAPVARIR